MCLSNVFGQSNDRIYLGHGHNYGPSYSYGISEMLLHSDSTYTRKNYNGFNKNDWKKYKSLVPEISHGIVSKNGKFYTLTELRSKKKTGHSWTVKITKRRMTFYYSSKNGKLKKGHSYRRLNSK
ncbi:MAG: hypothetical protein ABJP80_12350 [Algibacter sp.]